MSAQPNAPLVLPSYEQALHERTVLGCLLMDYLCHGRVSAPQAVMLFRRVLFLDAQLGHDNRYDRDHLEVVSAKEDARFHQPPRTVPDDHATRPCGLCRRLDLGLDNEVVLPPLRRVA